MEDLISRKAATSIPILPKEHRKVFRDEDDAFERGWNEALACVNRLPSVCLDLSDYCDRLWKLAYERGKAEPKTGEWIEEDEYGDLWVCDQCGFASEHKDNYCPNCGAKMVREDNKA